jgi:adenylyltransferase/sulfurtransferase
MISDVSVAMNVPLKAATIADVATDRYQRYQRQMLLPMLGQAAQQRLAGARVLLVGCGALGATIAEQLARAGVGYLRIADRDIVELSNLQRQVLFDEQHAAQGLPKAIAAAQRLGQINSTIQIDPRVVDVTPTNVEDLAGDVDLILDGTDNVSTRYLLNDVAVKLGRPWVYGACVGTEGRVMTIRPGAWPCLRCVFPTPPDGRQLPTCDTAGVLGPVAAVVGALEAVEAIKLLSGNTAAVAPDMLVIDPWHNRFVNIHLQGARRDDCPTCSRRRFEFLESRHADTTTRLCGRDAVQVQPDHSGGAGAVDLKRLAERLTAAAAGHVWLTPYLLRCTLNEGGLTLTTFADGRVIVKGTTDPARARAIVARYLGM